MDESFETAFALRDVWAGGGQHPCCPPPAHTLRPLAHRVHRANNMVKVSRTEKYIQVSSVFYNNLQLTKMVHAECLPTNSTEEPRCSSAKFVGSFLPSLVFGSRHGLAETNCQGRQPERVSPLSGIGDLALVLRKNVLPKSCNPEMRWTNISRM